VWHGFRHHLCLHLHAVCLEEGSIRHLLESGMDSSRGLQFVWTSL
jgi:hypothetical protein